MRKLALAAVKRQLDKAVSDLKDRGDLVYVELLARSMNVTRSKLDHILAFVRPEWRAELQLVDGRKESWNRLVVHRLYSFATELLLKEDRLPTPVNLGELLHITPSAVEWFMSHHPDLAKEIGFSREIESKVFYAGRKIRFRGEPVTRLAISREAGVAMKSVWRVLRKRPEFLEKLSLKETFERTPTCTNGQPVPKWIKGTVKITNVTLPSGMQLVDRILTTVCERHGVDCAKLTTTKGWCEHRAIYALHLAMFLLVEDAHMTPAQAGRLLGGRTGQQVNRGRQMVLKDIERACVQVELRALRNKIFRGYVR